MQTVFEKNPQLLNSIQIVIKQYLNSIKTVKILFDHCSNTVLLLFEKCQMFNYCFGYCFKFCLNIVLKNLKYCQVFCLHNSFACEHFSNTVRVIVCSWCFLVVANYCPNCYMMFAKAVSVLHHRVRADLPETSQHWVWTI